ncbi:MAG: hypothetical protein QOE70_4978 [Chthoniobacter sp.]|jgi:hypothetical protein|nr:hypothetical protein [Chthoniobacter sp.]
MSQLLHAFMRPLSPTYAPPERKPKRSIARTTAIVAGGAGLAYGGVQVGRAAGQVRKTAAAAEDAARKHARAMENAASVGGAVRKAGRVAVAPVRAVKKLFGFAAPQGTSVGRDRYVKQIHEKDVDRASGQYVRSAGAGALLGLALRKAGPRKAVALKGAGAGLAAQAVTRAGTAQTKDIYGDRSPGAKLVDKLPAPALLAAGITAASPKVRAKARAAKAAAGRAVRRGAQAAPQFAGDVVRESVKGMFGFSRRDALLHGAALAGGITGADVLTNSIVPEKGETRAHAAGKGLVKGAIYGSTLAIAEPAILAALKRIGPIRRKSRAIVPLASRSSAGKVIALRGRQQLYTDTPTAKGVFADPLKGASGEQDVYTRDEHGNRTPVDLPMGHAQVLRAAMNKGRDVHRWGSRTGRLAGDVADAARGKRKVDERGRPLKREWEKSYFRNMVGSAVVGAGLLGHAAAMKHKPAYRRSVRNKVGWAKQKANSVVPDLFPLAAKGPFGGVCASAEWPSLCLRLLGAGLGCARPAGPLSSGLRSRLPGARSPGEILARAHVEYSQTRDCRRDCRCRGRRSCRLQARSEARSESCATRPCQEGCGHTCRACSSRRRGRGCRDRAHAAPERQRKLIRGGGSVATQVSPLGWEGCSFQAIIRKMGEHILADQCVQTFFLIIEGIVEWLDLRNAIGMVCRRAVIESSGLHE